MNKMLTRSILGVGVAVLMSACNDDDNDSIRSTAPIANNVIAVAKTVPELSSLVQAVEFASINNDLLNVLERQRNLTVFAPTNEAFDALAAELDVPNSDDDPEINAKDLLIPKNRDLVRSILLNHILNEDLNTIELRDKVLQSIKSSNNKLLLIRTTRGGNLEIRDSSGRISGIDPDFDDVMTGNGTVHVIDTVLLPTEDTIVDTASKTIELSNLVRAINFATDSSNILSVLDSGADNPSLTVFAPNNLAFDQLAKALSCDNAATFESFVETNANNSQVKDTVRDVLRYHVLTDKVRLSGDFTANETLNTALVGKTSTVNATVTGITDLSNPPMNVSEFVPGFINILNSNGAVHVIDRVLLPLNPPACPTQPVQN